MSLLNIWNVATVTNWTFTIYLILMKFKLLQDNLNGGYSNGQQSSRTQVKAYIHIKQRLTYTVACPGTLVGRNRITEVWLFARGGRRMLAYYLYNYN